MLNKSRFSAYIQKRTAHNEKLLKVAIDAIDPKMHGDVTSYCTSLSKLITQLRVAHSNNPNSPYYQRQVKPQNPSTLLRNPIYREIIDNRFKKNTMPAIEQSQLSHEDLLLDLTRLQAENRLLHNKIVSIDSRAFTNMPDEAQKNIESQKLHHRIHVLLKAYKGIRISSRGVVDERYSDNMHSGLLGLYGIYGQILDASELKEIEQAHKELPEELRLSLSKSLSHLG